MCDPGHGLENKSRCQVFFLGEEVRVIVRGMLASARDGATVRVISSKVLSIPLVGAKSRF